MHNHQTVRIGWAKSADEAANLEKEGYDIIIALVPVSKKEEKDPALDLVGRGATIVAENVEEGLLGLIEKGLLKPEACK